MTDFPPTNPPPPDGPPPSGPPPGPSGQPPVPPAVPGPPPGAPPAYGAPAYGGPAYGGPAYGGPAYGSMPPAERVRVAWQQRAESDYRFDFWTALGWTILSCGIYGFYITYQLVRRSRDHNARRLEMLDAATALAWQQAEARGISGELQPNFDRIAVELGVLRQQTTRFRDPVGWMLISIVASTIANVIIFILLDGDLVDHDRAEGAVEHELSTIYSRLGAPVTAPDPSRMKQRHNYVGRIIATIFTCGIYFLWWEYDIMNEGNDHYDHNWRWEDSLAASVQQLAAA